MSSCESKSSIDTDQSFKPSSPNFRTKKWERDPQKALVFKAGVYDLLVEDITECNSMYRHLSPCHITKAHKITEESNAFEVQLPRWRNRVDMFKDMEAEMGFVVELHLNKIGLKKNWQRRLGLNYTVLHVKGNKLNQAGIDLDQIDRQHESPLFDMGGSGPRDQVYGCFGRRRGP